MKKTVLVAIAGVLLLELIGAYAFISLGLMPANADGKPPWIEKWAARKSLHAAVERDAPKGPNPFPPSDENLIAGARLYAANCAVCHGAADGKPSRIALGLYQKPPQLAKYGVEDDPEGETYWKIDHGIRMTGMPSYHATLTSEEMWRITSFLKHMDSLSAKALGAWKAIPTAK